MTVAVAKTTPGRSDLKGAIGRVRSLLTPLNLHFLALGVLGLVNLYLIAQLALAWQVARDQDASAIARQTTALQAAEAADQPLQGLDKKLTVATADADTFYAKRLPFSYSQVVGELGVLAKREGVKLTRVQYGQQPVLEGSAGELTEVRMDAALSGDYRPLVMLVNGLERDRMFFLIRGVTLTGQQSGTVGLRLSLTTYLRPAVGAEVTRKAVLDSATEVPGGGALR